MKDMRSIGCRTTSLLLTASAVAAMLLPPSHIHLASHDHDHGHAAPIEHAHWSSHGPSRVALDDDDGRAIFVDHPAVASKVDATLARRAVAVIAILVLPVPATFTVAERQTSGNSPRDGPALTPITFRGPPLVL